MAIDDQIRNEKIQYDINREVAKISALSSSNQQQIIEQTKFTYSPLGKAFEKQIKTIEDKEQKQIDALESLKPKEQTKAIPYDDESLRTKRRK